MKNKKAWKIIANIAEWVALVLLGLFAFRQIWNFVDTKNGAHHPLFGRKDTVIVSGSMSFVNDKNAVELKDCKDQIQINDVIVTSNRISYETLKVHDVILFRRENRDICHRIIKKYISDDKKEMLVTRGDANEIPDGPIEYACVIGKVVKVRPKIGKLVSFVNSPYFLLGISLSVGFVSVGLLLANGKKKPKEESATNSQPVKEKSVQKAPTNEPKKVEVKPVQKAPKDEPKKVEVKPTEKVEEKPSGEKKELTKEEQLKLNRLKNLKQYQNKNK